MYQSYLNGGRGGRQGGRTIRERMGLILSLLLVAALVTLSVVGIPAIRFKGQTRDIYVARMQTEANAALSQAAQLSRTAGADSSTTLGRIRANLHAVQTLNEVYSSQTGGDTCLVDRNLFVVLFALIDEYADTLITGMSTTNLQTNLTLLLNQMADTVQAL